MVQTHDGRLPAASQETQFLTADFGMMIIDVKRMTPKTEDAIERERRMTARKTRQKAVQTDDGDLSQKAEVTFHAPHIVQESDAYEKNFVHAGFFVCQFQCRIRRMKRMTLIDEVHRIEQHTLPFVKKPAHKSMIAFIQMRCEGMEKLQNPLFHEM